MSTVIVLSCREKLVNDILLKMVSAGIMGSMEKSKEWRLDPSLGKIPAIVR
jgi:hypothetical protein